MSLYERIILEFCIIVAGAALLWEFIRMWRERRRTRRELWQILYEKGKGRDGVYEIEIDEKGRWSDEPEA